MSDTEKRIAEIESRMMDETTPCIEIVAIDTTWLVAELRASQAECSAYKKAKSENDDRFLQERDAARAQLAEARHHANHCADCCGLIFDLVKP